MIYGARVYEATTRICITSITQNSFSPEHLPTIKVVYRATYRVHVCGNRFKHDSLMKFA